MIAAHLALQLLVILAAARALGWLVQRVGQPAVIGEMLAGIALGPSLLGAVAPDLAARLFPVDAMAPLGWLSQLAVLLFMFVVGLRFDLELLRSRAGTAIAVSHTSIALPFLLGVACALWMYPSVVETGATTTGSARLAFALFIGAAMSVTAFPVLARILRDRRLERTPIGAVTLASAAVDDATAWGILACVAAFARAEGGASSVSQGLWSAMANLALVAIFVLALMYAVRPLLRRGLHDRALPLAFLTCAAMLYALGAGTVTDRLGVHALFGAFVAGLTIPRHDALAHHIALQLDRVGGTLLLPLFFAFSGLRTSITLLASGELWLWTLVVTVVAVLGKFGGSAIAARVTGMPWRDASAVGVLMNTRGLMALVVLNVGLDLALITPTVFAMMVAMALITTIMTTPLLAVLGVSDRANVANGPAVPPPPTRASS